LTFGALKWKLSCFASYRLRVVSNGRYAAYCRPAVVTFLVTELCNARCTHCDIWKNKGKEDAPTLDQWKQVLYDLRHWLGPATVTLSGGEALLRKDTPEILRYGGELGMFMELLSHGYWPDAKRMEEVARAKPWKVTFSVDGIGDVHNVVRGKADFWDRTSASLDTLIRLRNQQRQPFKIQLKNVLMRQNLQSATSVARFADEKGVSVLYQCIEQNYNTAPDPLWYRTSPNWPENQAAAVEVVDSLIALKQQDLPIDNTLSQLVAMKNYFLDPDGLRLRIQAHTAHEVRAACSGMTNLQIRANGDVGTCANEPPFGNIKQSPIRELWHNRPRYWETHCCLQSANEPQASQLHSIKQVGA